MSYDDIECAQYQQAEDERMAHRICVCGHRYDMHSGKGSHCNYGCDNALHLGINALRTAVLKRLSAKERHRMIDAALSTPQCKCKQFSEIASEIAKEK